MVRQSYQTKLVENVKIEKIKLPPKLKNSNETFWDIFKQYVTVVENHANPFHVPKET